MPLPAPVSAQAALRCYSSSLFLPSSWPGVEFSCGVCTHVQYGSLVAAVRQAMQGVASSLSLPAAGPWTLKSLRRVVLLQWLLLTPVGPLVG